MVFIFVYRLLYSPLLFLLSLFKGFHPKIKKGFLLRQPINNIYPWLNYRKNTQPIWFHCASGEYEYAKPVIRELKQKNPQQKILVTYFSPSIEKALNQATDIDFFCPTPWDKPHLWQEFIEHHNPKALLIARTDLWPAMLSACSKMKIPKLLFSKTVNNKKKFLSKLIEGPLMKTLDDIFCATETDRQLLYAQLKPYPNIHASGDTRYDQCFFRLKNGKALKPLNNFNKPIFVAGSTWPLDEQVLLPAIAQSIKELSFIIAPHEPSEAHLNSLIKDIKKQQLKYQLYSQTQNWDPRAILIIDQVGILADLYAWSTMSFIGGSMGRSVHSVLEPLAQGNLSFVGPRHYNNREALFFKETKIKDLSPVLVVQNSDQLLDRIQTALSSWSPTHKFELQQTVQKRTGASKIVVQWIENNQRNSL